MTSEAVQIAAYGIYLMHGGKPQDFEDLTPDDLQVIFTTYTSMQTAANAELLNGLGKMLKGD